VLRDRVHTAFLDELQKISEVSLAGLSHESVQRLATPAAPMETAGLSKALAVLARYEGMPKLAFLDRVSNPNLPGMQRMTGVKKKGKKSSDGAAQQTGSAAAHTLGGMGAGRMVADFAQGPKAIASGVLRKHQWHGMAAGAALGASVYAGKRLAKRQSEREKQAALVPTVQSPAKQLHYGQQTGKTQAHGLKSGPSIHRLATKV